MELSRRSFVGAAMAAPVAYALASAEGALGRVRPPARPSPDYTLRPVSKVKLFDPSDRTGFGQVTNLSNFTDTTIVKLRGRWTLIGGADAGGRLGIYSASLPPGAPLSATGWKIDTVPGDPTTAAALVADPPLEAWDGAGGRHCASYVRGWDPALKGGRGGWQERIYYAGSNPSFGGPYSIGYVVWDGHAWVVPEDVPQPVFVATEPWESPTGRFAGVYEPNLIYHDGWWHMWYVAGPPNADGHMPQGYAVSRDGRTGWRKQIYWPAEQDVFDNAVIQTRGGARGRGRGGAQFEAVFSRFALSFEPTADWGLWWYHADRPYDNPARWSEPVQIVRANDGTPWHALGVWKPTIQHSDRDPRRAFVFFDGGFTGPTGRPDYSTGCVECEVVRR